MKYFIVSDIHSFYTPLNEALHEAGYDKKNKEHTLVVLGDIFDRGNETLEVYKFLKSIPKSRCILVKGNHESLYFELLKKDFPESYDFSNGTVQTFCDIANEDIKKLDTRYYYKTGNGLGCHDKMRAAWKNIITKVAESDITKWLNSAQWINYFELDKFIMTHSFIPYVYNKELPNEFVTYKDLRAFSNWRTDATEQQWNDAKWGCPWKLYLNHIFDLEINNNKVLVCGHWHTGDFYKNLDNKSDKITDIYCNNNIIAIDGGVQVNYSSAISNYILTHDQNVLIIDEEFNCYNKKNIKIK